MSNPDVSLSGASLRIFLLCLVGEQWWRILSLTRILTGISLSVEQWSMVTHLSSQVDERVKELLEQSAQ